MFSLAVKTFYVSKAGNTKLANNFIVKEFASHDGADKVLIDTDLVAMLQKIRDHFGRAVSISSAYRTAGYNASIGGSKSSYHVKGQAADITVKGVNPVIVGMYANSIAGGLGVYAYATGGFCHIDTRTVKYRWLAIVRGGDNQQISSIMPVIKQGGTKNTTNAVMLLQRKLGVSQSGTFGDFTTAAVKNYQSKQGLKVDGIVGFNTWNKLFA